MFNKSLSIDGKMLAHFPRLNSSRQYKIMETFIAINIFISFTLLMLFFSLMKWELYKSEGIKTFFKKHMFWGHSEVLKEYKKLLTKTECQKELKTKSAIILYGLYFSLGSFGILCLYLFLIESLKN